VKNLNLRSGLLATTTLCGAVFVASLAAPASAQDSTSTDTKAKKDTAPTEVVVTGSILRKKALTSISPLVVTTAADYEKRGITTIDQAAQHLSGNNGGTITNNWSTFGFSTGASGLSLRGLTSNSTLVLVDGLRMAYYPLGDDATRNFVDLNTIPDATIDHIETLQDGASSAYGADAIAGVVNVITKKNFQGLQAKLAGGQSEKGFGGEVNGSVLWGKGDLASDGWNFYVSGEYQNDALIPFSKTDYPYNTANQSKTCAPSLDTDKTHWGAAGSGINAAGITCRTNGNQNGIQFDDTLTTIGTTTVAMVRPYNATTLAAAGNWQLINPTLGCSSVSGSLNPITLTAHEAIAGAPAGTKLCQQDLVHDYQTMAPKDTRKSLSAHFTKRFDNDTQAYAVANWYENDTFLTGNPSSIRNQATPGAAGTTATTAAASSLYPTAFGIYLPVYVCPRGTVGTCDLTHNGGKYNPNNPFATAGQIARISYRLADVPDTTATKSNTFRVAAGLQGRMMGWDYNLDATAMQTDLTVTQAGRIHIQHLIDVVNDGSYNFMDPSQNTQAVRDYIAPTVVQKSKSQLAMIQFNASRDIMELGGGSMTLGLGAQYRYEGLNNPSANPDPLSGINPVTGTDTNRFFTINPYGAHGQHTVAALAFELDAPFTPKWDVQLSGREDSYSTKFSAFSPKIASSYKLTDTLTVRATFSKGFRAPSIDETNADPTTGFVTQNAPKDFQNITHAKDGYGASYSLGLTTVSDPNLKPEKSENTTMGFVWQPNKTFGFTFDYYIIHKSDIIAGADFQPAIDAYFAGQPIPAGFKVIPGAVDPNLPNAMPLPGFVQYSLQNLNSQDTAGMDLQMIGRFDLPLGIKWTSTAEGAYIQYYTQTYKDGRVQRYDGTLGNNQITSGSGTPKWRWNWANTFEKGKWAASATLYYISGYKSDAADNGDDYYGDEGCVDSGTAAFYRDATTPVVCNVKSFVDVDTHVSYQVNKNYTLYLDVMNTFGAKAPQDPSSTYGITNYNVAFHSAGVVGRYFKVGAKLNF
jgi:iron complex outermembrane receptor protein